MDLQLSVEGNGERSGNEASFTLPRWSAGIVKLAN